MRRLGGVFFPLLVFVLFVGVTPGIASSPMPRIVNGQAADVELAEFVVRIVTDDDRLCTGTLIDRRWVLTAGHCISSRATVYVGDTTVDGLESAGGATGHVHPYYSDADEVPRFDFGLYELDAPTGEPVTGWPLLIDVSDSWAWIAGTSATAAGWGLTSASGSLTTTLQQANLQVQDDSTCESLDLTIGAIFDPTTAICATDALASACNGDSGGPLLVRDSSSRYAILGVTSYGPEDCDGHSVFGWMPAGISWIRSVTGLPLGSGSTSSSDRVVTRIFGLDRYETSAAVGAFWDDADSVFVATGAKFPDALAAGATAAASGSPVLLVNSNGVPDATRYQIRRLAPSTIYVAGGPAAIDDGVIAELGAIVGSNVVRFGGVDRYETSDLLGGIADAANSGGRIWVASGRDFADPLVASTAAAVFGEGFVLIDGINPVPERTMTRLRELSPSKIVVLGDDSSFGPAVRASLSSVATIQYLTGGDASWRSAMVWGDLTDSQWVSLATVENFPDALSAVPFSSIEPVSPLMLTPSDCVPTAVRDQVARLGAERVALFGGPAALSNRVETLQPC